MTRKNRIVRAVTLALWALAVLAVSYTFAAQRAAVCSYVSINGDFQSYNVFRRILAGQWPYADFANYIGMAPIAVNILPLLADGSFAASLFVTTFTSNVIFALAVALLLWLATRQLQLSCFVSAFLAKAVSTQILVRVLGGKYGTLLTERFAGLYTPSNSMRGTRSFLPFLLCGLVLLVTWLYQRRTGRSVNYLQLLPRTRVLAALGGVLGFFIPWSNDYGLGAVAAMLVLLAVLELFCWRMPVLQFLKKLAVFALCVGAGLLVCTTLITGGRPGAWFAATADIGEYQYFYFDGTYGMAVLPYIFKTPELWLFAGIFIAFWIWALVRLVRGAADNALVLLVFISLTVTAATFAYILSGSGFNCREALEVYSLLLAAALALRAALCWKPLLAACRWGCICLLTVLLGYSGWQSLTLQPAVTGTYIEELGGYNTDVTALVEAAELVGDEQVFSTYATGLEVVTDQFQPTGYDYIIHALGRDVQAEYARDFAENEYSFVHTSRLPVETWVSGRNWHFYRLLLPHYTQVLRTEYGWIWERSEEELYIDADVQVSVEQIDPYSVRISCTSSVTDTFVADLQVSWHSEFEDFAHWLYALGRTSVLTRTSCIVAEDMGGWFRAGSATEYLPVKMQDGHGELIISGGLGGGLLVTVQDAQYIAAMPVLDHIREDLA